MGLNVETQQEPQARIVKRVTSGPTVPGQIPLVFGITGHRDLRDQDREALEQGVRGIFVEFQQRYPATPLSLLSPLAEGADRLAARVALECGVTLISPLPMPRDLYEMDFESAESRTEFDMLLSQADEWFELPLVTGNSAAALAAGAAGREWQYAQVGAYIVRQSQILIALWDGLPSEKIGSTAEVVHLRSTGISAHELEKLAGLPRRSHLDPVESGPIFHLLTPRVSDAEVPTNPFTLRKEFHPREDTATAEREARQGNKEAEAEEVYHRIYANLNAYNENALAVSRDPKLTALRNQSEGYLMPDGEADALPMDLRNVRACHAVADILAQRFQQDTERTLIFLSGLVFAAATLFELYEIGHDPLFLLFYPLFLGVVYAGWSLVVKRGRWQDKYQDYRALAEGLRVEFFWRLIGQTSSVADHYLRKQRSELDWIRIAIQNVVCAERILPTFESDSAGTLPEDVQRVRWELVLKRWVEDQAKYFQRSAIPKNEQKLERVERGVKFLLIGSQCIPAVLAILLVPKEFPEAIKEGIEPVRHWLEAGMHEHILVGVSALMAVVAGLLHTYADTKAFAQHVKQYKRMERVFARAARHLREDIAHDRFHQATELLIELGKESLEENADWVLTHRERPVDVPHAG